MGIKIFCLSAPLWHNKGIPGSSALIYPVISVSLWTLIKTASKPQSVTYPEKPRKPPAAHWGLSFGLRFKPFVILKKSFKIIVLSLLWFPHTAQPAIGTDQLQSVSSIHCNGLTPIYTNWGSSLILNKGFTLNHPTSPVGSSLPSIYHTPSCHSVLGKAGVKQWIQVKVIAWLRHSTESVRFWIHLQLTVRLIERHFLFAPHAWSTSVIT